MIRTWIAAAAIVLAGGTLAHSQILAEHHPAPLADEIRLTNVAECTVGPVELGVFFDGSDGALEIASTPVAVRLGAAELRVGSGKQETTPVEVIDNALFVALDSLGPGESVAIAVKLESAFDDAELMVFGRVDAPIAGAEAVVFGPEDQQWLGLFGRSGQAMVQTNACHF